MFSAYLYCELCPAIISYRRSSITNWNDHIRSKRHLELSEQKSPTSSMNQPVQSSEPLFGEKLVINATDQEILNFGVKLTKNLVGQGKMSAYAMNTEWFQDAMHYGAKELDVGIPKNFMPSRQTISRIIQKEADEEREKTKKDIAEAARQNPDVKFTLQFDDGLIKNGMKENVRAVAVGWFDEITGIERRFIRLTEEFDKSADSIRESLKKAVHDFQITDNFALLSDAASTNMAITQNPNSEWYGREHTTCGDHMFHNGLSNGNDAYRRINKEFNLFFQTIEKTLDKSSRWHINQIMLNVDGWRKLRGICKTRWASVIDGVESILVNWEILAAHPKAKKLPLFENQTITKNDLQAFFNLIEPFRRSIIILEGYRQSNGHLMAMELQNILIFNVNYMANSMNPEMLRGLAAQFVKQAEEYFDGVPAKNGGYKKLKRIDSIRLIQTAFYLPSNMLAFFDPNINGPVLDENKKISMSQRYKRLNAELHELISKYDSQNDAHNNMSHNSSNSSLTQQSFSKSSLEMEVYLFSSLAEKYTNSSKSEWPSILIEFDQNLSKKLDANSLFWQSVYVKDTFPLLRKIVCPYLAVSASTSLIEGTFSQVNQIRTAKRSRLLTKNIDNFLVLHYARTLDF